MIYIIYIYIYIYISKNKAPNVIRIKSYFCTFSTILVDHHWLVGNWLDYFVGWQIGWMVDWLQQKFYLISYFI